MRFPLSQVTYVFISYHASFQDRVVVVICVVLKSCLCMV